MHPLPERILEKLRGIRRTHLILLTGLCGTALLLLPGLLPDRKEPLHTGIMQNEPANTALYRQELEERLTKLLSGMEGVGQVQVMVTVSGTAEQVYAEERKTSQSDRGTQLETQPVIIRSSGGESALAAKTYCPAVQGAAILCEGGSHAAVQERVSRAAAAVLGIPQTRIFVGKSAISDKF